MISNRCARKSLVTNCNSIISKNYLRFLVDSNVINQQIMKLTDKRFWNGEKKVYYPSFKYALTDSLLWSILWTGIIYLLLSVSCLIIHFTKGSNLSWDDISFILIFQCIVFSISNGMFLYENWYKQKCTIRKTKRLLPNEYHWQHIEYNAIGKKYTIQGDYQGKVFIIKVDVLSQE